jgi:hypothetical protein
MANQPPRVLHFMGYGGLRDGVAYLYFERENGAPDPVSARDLTHTLDASVFLVTLNACDSAAAVSNLARALAEGGIPYALGMGTKIPDEAAVIFGSTFYAEMGRGSPVETALHQARFALSRSAYREAATLPILYTALTDPGAPFAALAGKPRIITHQPALEFGFDLPGAEGAFQGRMAELLRLGEWLTQASPPKIITIHGVGGQSKTALAREAMERYAHAWPDGVWAISLEPLPSRAAFVLRLAQNLKLQPSDYLQPAELEWVVLHLLNQQRPLIVLDNAETYLKALRAEQPEAFDLAEFLRDGLLATQISLLVTSREPLGLPGEVTLLLPGLAPIEGAYLFWQNASLRQGDIMMSEAGGLSQLLEGHPLALLLLGRRPDGAAPELPLQRSQLDRYAHQPGGHHRL